MLKRVRKGFISFALTLALLITSIPVQAAEAEEVPGVGVEDAAIGVVEERTIGAVSTVEKQIAASLDISEVTQEILKRFDAQAAKKESGSKITVDVSDLGLYADDALYEKVKAELDYAMGSYGSYRYEYVRDFTTYRKVATGAITEIDFGVHARYKEGGDINWKKIDAEMAAMEYEIQRAMSGISEDMTITEKTLVLHDYLVKNCRYEMWELDGTAYGALVEGRAACGGYTVGLAALLEAAGLQTAVVYSPSEMHSWIMVQLEDGNWYHIDPTWNDDWDYLWFLNNDVQIEEMGHVDWYTMQEVPANREHVADFAFRNIPTELNCIDGRWYCLVGAELGSKIVQTTLSGDMEDELELGFYAERMYAYQDKLYFNTDEKIYELDPDTWEMSVFYSTSSRYVISEFDIAHQKCMEIILEDIITGARMTVYENLETVSLEQYVFPYDKIVFDEEESTKQLEMICVPAYADNIPKVLWFSEDEEIVTVDQNGLATAVGNGTTEIVVRNDNMEEIARCAVTVDWDAFPVTGMELAEETMLLSIIGETFECKAEIAPYYATNKNVKWTSSDTSVVTVDEKGVVTAVGTGTATITAITVDGGFTDTCVVTVDTNEVTEISLNFTEAVMTQQGETLQLEATVSPETAQNKEIIWSISDRWLVMIEDGLVTAKDNGEVLVTARVKGTNKCATCLIKVEIPAENQGTGTIDYTSADVREIVRRLKAELAKQESNSYVSVDISDLGIPSTMWNGGLYSEVADCFWYDPEYFYVESLYGSNSGGIYTTMECSLKNAYVVSGKMDWDRIGIIKTALENEVNQVLSYLYDDMSDVEKALFVHDYLLASTTVYDNGAYDYVTMESVLLRQEAHSKGYAVVFKMFMDKLGIPCKVMEGTKEYEWFVQNYSWNMIRLDGEWYHVDLAGDKAAEEPLSHQYFLLGDEELGEEYEIPDGAPEANVNDSFSGYCFRDADCRMNFYKGYWFYMVPTENGSTIVKSKVDGSEKTQFSVEGTAYDMHGAGNVMYYSVADKIYTYDTVTGTTEQYYDAATEFEGYMITEFTLLCRDVLVLTLYNESTGEYIEKRIVLRAVPALAVYLKSTYLSIGVSNPDGEIELEYVPSYATETIPVTWEVEDPGVLAVVMAGTVVPRVNGSTNVVAKTLDGTVIGKCNVNVYMPIRVTGITLDESAVTFREESDGIQLNATIMPADAWNQSVEWESSDPSVAIVDEWGHVAAVGDGKAIITAITSDGGYTATCEVTVDTKSVIDVEITGSLTLFKEIGETYQFYWKVLPSGAVNKNVTWTSSNPEVLTVDENGLVTALSSGRAVITVTTEEGGFTDAVEVTMWPDNRIYEIKITSGDIILGGVGEQRQLYAQISPNTAVDDSLVWTCGDAKIVSVDSKGVVTALSPGRTHIAARNQQGTIEGIILVTVASDQYTGKEREDYINYSFAADILTTDVSVQEQDAESALPEDETEETVSDLSVSAEDADTEDVLREIQDDAGTYDTVKSEQSSTDLKYRPSDDAKYFLTYRVSEDGIIITGMTTEGISREDNSLDDDTSEDGSLEDDTLEDFDLGELVIPRQIDGVTVTRIGAKAFANKAFAGDLIIPSGVKEIGDWTFLGCNKFDGELTIPGSVTIIGKRAFSGCFGLTGNLVIPEGVEVIEEGAFSVCNGFNGILSLPESLTKIGESAFASCLRLTGDLTIPTGVTEIEESVFAGCVSLDGVLTLPEGVTKIGTDAFEGCGKLTGSLVIPGSVTEIGDYAFSNCKGFSGTLVVPESVTIIGKEAFWSCKGLERLKLSEGLTTIGKKAFYWCSGLTGDLTIPGSVIEIGKEAFAKCTGFNGRLTIEQGVTKICEKAFYKCGFTGDLTIPEGVTVIEEDAFWNCSSFDGILTIPRGVTEIARRAFYNCSGFVGGLKLPEGLTTIGELAFYNCSGMKGALDIPVGVCSIGKEAFWNCHSLTGNLQLPEGLTQIGELAFYNCSSLNGSLSIPDSVMQIGEMAFYNCNSLTGALIIPQNVTTVGKWTFGNCSGLNGGLIIPEGVTEIGEYAFYNCSNLTGDLNIPESVNIIGEAAFTDCSGFTGNLNLPAKMSKIGREAFSGCSGLTGDLAVPFRITKIEDYTFRNCSGLTGTLTLPSSLKRIGFSAFYNCKGLCDEELVLPQNVDEIGMWAFSGDLAQDEEEKTEDPLTAFVERMYTEALARDGEQDGIDYWVARLLSGEDDGAGIAHGFLLSPEFVNKNHPDSDYVKVLYATFFDREPAAEEVSYWTDKLANGNTREFVLAGFVNSNEFDTLCAGYGISRGFLRQDGTGLNPGIIRFTERLYTKALERDGEKEGIEYWALRIADGVATPEEAAKSFFLSPEYINRNTTDEHYIKALYRTFMDREAEGDGITYWQNVINEGATREAVLTGFAQSPEFQGIMAEYGL